MDFIPAYNFSRQRIKIPKYKTTTFAYHSTSYLFNGLIRPIPSQDLETVGDLHDTAYEDCNKIPADEFYISLAPFTEDFYRSGEKGEKESNICIQ